jgi:hypothetical protein
LLHNIRGKTAHFLLESDKDLTRRQQTVADLIDSGFICRLIRVQKITDENIKKKLARSHP